MNEQFGSPSEWQRHHTHQWIEKLSRLKTDRQIIFEGQMNIAFIQEAFEKVADPHYQIILIDCTAKEMNRRLIEERNQPELANEDMKNWLAYLRNQAQALGISILNTANQPLTHTLQELLLLVKR